jgi:signal transduction histidine kinase
VNAHSDSDIDSAMSAPPPTNFVAFLGHDLRSHLTAIIGFSRLLQRRAQLEPKQQDNLEKILVAAEQQLQLINTIVDLAKSESGTLELLAEPCDLSALLSNISDSVRQRVQDQGLRLMTQWPALPTLYQLDERRLYQVLMQLLDNAIRYTDRGEITLRVEQDNDDNDRFRFYVQNTGTRLEPERIRQLLQAAAPLPGARGTGLGLVLCRVLIELMGGRLNITSNEKTGNCFSFELHLPALTASGAYHSNATGTGRPHDRPHPLKLSRTLIDTLIDLAMQGDIKGLLDQAEMLEQHDDELHRHFAGELKGLAKSFQVNKICELLTTMKSPV